LAWTASLGLVKVISLRIRFATLLYVNFIKQA
jgi:hypothetical protein